MRKICLKIHKWLALPLGVFMAILCFTGFLLLVIKDISPLLGMEEGVEPFYKAVKQLLEKTGTDPEEIECLIMATTTLPLSISATVATWFAIGHLMYRRRYLQLFLALLTLVCTNLVAWLMGQEVGPHLQHLTIFTTVCFGIVVVLRRADTSVAKAEATRIEALHNQRALIARELHDTLARANTHIVLLAQNARNNPHDHHQTTTALDDIITTGRQSVTDLRTMLRLLRQDTNTPLDPTPTANLHTALTQTQHDLTTAGLHTTITHEGDLTTLSPTLTTTLTHILHESTANMIKHAAPDAQCTIQLDITDTHAELLVINPLANHHHDQQLSSGLGLLGIQERSRALGGTTTITPTAHQWILHTTLPLVGLGWSGAAPVFGARGPVYRMAPRRWSHRGSVSMERRTEAVVPRAQ